MYAQMKAGDPNERLSDFDYHSLVTAMAAATSAIGVKLVPS